MSERVSVNVNVSVSVSVSVSVGVSVWVRFRVGLTVRVRDRVWGREFAELPCSEGWGRLCDRAVVLRSRDAPLGLPCKVA